MTSLCFDSPKCYFSQSLGIPKMTQMEVTAPDDNHSPDLASSFTMEAFSSASHKNSLRFFSS